jgi:type II secretory pathway pseudopilin PulG
MKTSRKPLLAFTVIELCAVIATLSLLAAMLLPALARTKASSKRISCSDNLKQIGLAFQNFAADHGGAFPTRVTLANGGYFDYLGQRVISISQSTGRGVFGVFMVMSNYLASPKLLVCPAENETRFPATTFSGVIPPGSTNAFPLTNDMNTSYFVGVDATTTSARMLLSGDHNLGSDGNLVPFRGFVTPIISYSPDFRVSLGNNFTTNSGVGWLNTMHSKQGNAVMGDCSVQQFDRAHLQQTLHNSGDPGSGSIGIFSVPIGCSGAGINRVQFP